jgi:hypothetical protein
VVIVGHIDDIDGLVVRRRTGCDWVEFRVFEVVSDPPLQRIGQQISVSVPAGGQAAEVIDVVGDAARAGKKLRITVEVVD